MAVLSVTAASVLKSSNGQTVTGTVAAGVTITQGQWLYLTSALTLGLAASNQASPVNVVEGVATSAGSPGQQVTYIRSDSGFTTGATLATSAPTIWLSNTAGSATATFSDLASGSKIVALGQVNTDLTLNFSQVIGGVK